MKPALEVGANGLIQCPLTAAWTGGTGTFTVNAAKNRATPQLLEVTVPAGGAVGQVLVNTTHPSHALVYTNVAGNEWNLSQPLLSLTPPFSLSSVTEVDTWATNDTVTGNTPGSVDLADLEPGFVGQNGSANNLLYVSQCTAMDDQTGDSDPLTINNSVILQDTIVQRTLFIAPTQSLPSIFELSGLTNTDVQDSYRIQSSVAPSTIVGGVIRGVFAGQGFLDGDMIFANATNAIPAITFIGMVYVENGATLEFSGGSSTLETLGRGGPFVWGPGGIGVFGNSRLAYAPGSGVAATVFLQKTAWSIEGQIHSCLSIPILDAGFGPCNITLSTANLDTNLGASRGCIFVPGASAVCNF